MQGTCLARLPSGCTRAQECFQQDAAGPVKVDLISSRPARSWSLHEICLTKASANVTMVQFFFWKLTQLTDQLHSTGEIKGCGEGRGFTTFKSQTKTKSPAQRIDSKQHREQRKLTRDFCLVFIKKNLQKNKCLNFAHISISIHPAQFQNKLWMLQTLVHFIVMDS